MFLSNAAIPRRAIRLAKQLAQSLSKPNLLQAAHLRGRTLTALLFMGAAAPPLTPRGRCISPGRKP